MNECSILSDGNSFSSLHCFKFSFMLGVCFFNICLKSKLHLFAAHPLCPDPKVC